MTHPFKDKSPYPVNTLGYYWYVSVSMFGPRAFIVQQLEKEAAASPDGMYKALLFEDEDVVPVLWEIEKHGV